MCTLLFCYCYVGAAPLGQIISVQSSWCKVVLACGTCVTDEKGKRNMSKEEIITIWQLMMKIQWGSNSLSREGWSTFCVCMLKSFSVSEIF